MQSHRWLSCAEGDDAPDRIVRGDAHGDAITGDDLDSEAAHPSAQLGEDLMTGITLDSIQPPGMHRYHRSLHIYQIVFAQQLILSNKQPVCHTGKRGAMLRKLIIFRVL